MVHLPALDPREIGATGERIVRGESVHQHQHFVGPTAPELRRGRTAASGASHSDSLPPVEGAGEIASSNGQLLTRDGDLAGCRHDSDAVEL